MRLLRYAMGASVGLGALLAPAIARAAAASCWGTGLDRFACEDSHHSAFFGGIEGLIMILILILATILGQDPFPELWGLGGEEPEPSREPAPKRQEAAGSQPPEQKPEPSSEKKEGGDEEPEDEEPAGYKPIYKEPRKYGDGKENPWDPTVAEQKKMWKTKGVVWDPTTMSWREPKPDELEKPEGLPSDTPFQRQKARGTVPFACLPLYDEYARAQSRVKELEDKINTYSDAYQFAQDELNKQLAKFTLKLGYNVGNLVGGGVTGVIDAKKMTQAAGLGQRERWVGTPEIYGELNAAIAAARRRLGEIVERMSQLAGELLEAAAEAAERNNVLRSLREGYESAREKLASLMPRVQQMETKAAQLEGQLSTLREVSALEAEAAHLGQQALTGRQRLDEIRKYRQHMAQWGQAMEEWRLKNNNIGFLKHQGEGLDIQIQARMARTDGLSAAEKAELAQWRQELENIRAAVSEWEKTGVGMDDYIRTKVPDSHAYMKNNPFSGTDLARNADTMAAEEARLVQELGEVQQRQVKVRSRVDAVQSQVAPGTTVDATQANLKETQAALAETKAAIQEQKVTVDAAAAKLPEAETVAAQATAKKEALEEQARALRAEKATLEASVGDNEAKLKAIEAGQGPTDSSGANAAGLAGAMTRALAAAGRTWEQAMGSEQSPEEVGEILTRLRLQVLHLRNQLESAKQEHDAAMAALRDIKPRLDRCIEEHSFYGQDN